ncbi:MAG: aldehyde dehydrogenase family protein [Actinomycetota bacterium]|nr:aldehyde dehydrogenase family protein [Actinomycetota bacterium]
MHVRDRLFIGGEWVQPAGEGVIELTNPATEAPLGRVPAGTTEDIDRAVAAARAAFDGWAATPLDERTACLDRLHLGLMARATELGSLVAQEVGMAISTATVIQGALPALIAKTFVDIARVFPFEERAGASTVVYEPVGVVGCLTPWNYPVLLAISKVAPAVAAGCTVVLKPSEIAPLTAFVLAEEAAAAGFPPGVVNVVTGFGRDVGEHVVTHPDVDMVSFTGSTAVGRRVAALAAQSLKRFTLELGGKSASVVLDDADLEEAVQASVRQALLNSGQTCMAWSRLIVPRQSHDEAAIIARKMAEQLTVGDPMEDATELGPVATASQRDRVRRYIDLGIGEGATLVTGGSDQPDHLPRGYYVRPTVFADVLPGMTIAQEEIFGPVVAILPADDEDDAVRIANGTPYGLHGAVFSRSRARGERVARRLRTGQVDVCGVGGYNPIAPFGGYKQSGHGRELGRWGLEEFLEVKSLQLP